MFGAFFDGCEGGGGGLTTDKIFHKEEVFRVLCQPHRTTASLHTSPSCASLCPARPALRFVRACHSIPHCVLCIPTARHPFRLVLFVSCHSIPFYGLPTCIPRATCPATPNGKKRCTPIYNVPARSQSEPIQQKNPPKPSLEG